MSDGYIIITAVLLAVSLRVISDDVCVMQSVCGQGNLPCRVMDGKHLNSTYQITDFCPTFPEGALVCCDARQISAVRDGLYQAGYWFGCPQQSQFVTPTKCDDDKAMLEADATITKEQANKLFDACKDIKFWFITLVNKVCIKQPCDAEEFIRSLGTSKLNGGKAPFQMNFKFV